MDIVPTRELPPTVPLTSQFTAMFEVFATVAENCWVCPTITLALVGLMDTDTIGGGGGGAVLEPPPQPGQSSKNGITAISKDKGRFVMVGTPTSRRDVG